jgi:hypothetical protein
MRLLISSLAAALIFPASSVLAKGSADATGYTDDIDGRCQVWAPSMLGQRDYAVRYRGACKNGRAEGKGKAEWLYRYAEMKVKATWEGDFRNGVFLDGQTIRGKVEPVSGDKYVVDMGKVSGADLLFISRSPQDGPFELCKLDQLALVLGPKAAAADDDQVRRIMTEGVSAYRNACPSGGNLRIGVFSEPLTPGAHGRLPNPIARARIDDETGKLAGYSNDAAAKAQREKDQAEYARKEEESRKQFNAFSSKHGIAAWLTVQQLDENPFRWEGKTVGLVVRLERMLARDTALVGGLRNWGPSLQLKGITPDFPESRYSVVLAARVGKREKQADNPENNGATYVTLTHVDNRLCERNSCSDWFIWARGNNELIWGEPFTAR